MDAFALAQWFCLFMAPEESLSIAPFKQPNQTVETERAGGETVAKLLAETERQLDAFRQEVATAQPVTGQPDNSERLRSTSKQALTSVDPELRVLKADFTHSKTYMPGMT